MKLRSSADVENFGISKYRQTWYKQIWWWRSNVAKFSKLQIGVKEEGMFEDYIGSITTAAK